MYKFNSGDKTLTINVKSLYESGVDTLVLEDLDLVTNIKEETKKQDEVKDSVSNQVKDKDGTVYNFYELLNKISNLSKDECCKDFKKDADLKAYEFNEFFNKFVTELLDECKKHNRSTHNSFEDIISFLSSF